MTCSRCGAQVGEGRTFCGQCGAPVRVMSGPPDARKRPLIVSILAVTHFIGAAFVLVGVFIVIGSLAAGRGGPRAIVLVGLILGGVGFLQVLCGLGLWGLKSYGRTLQLVFGWIGLIAFPIGTVISILILVYFFKPGVKALFSGKPASELTAEELTQIAALQQNSQAVVVLIAIIGLMFVVAVLGIGAAIVIPALVRTRVSANEASTTAGMRASVSAETFCADGDGRICST